MKLSKEMKVWVKQEETRKKSCLESIQHLERQIKLLERTIDLERQQAELIQQAIDIALEQWRKAP